MKDKKTIFLLIILAIEAFFIFSQISAISLWHDEAFSALLIRYDFSEMIERISLDVHPPFYYILLRAWNFFFGDSLASLRGFSLFFWFLTVLTVYFLVIEAFKNKNLALFSSILISFNSFQIQYAMEARMYSLGNFLILLSCLFLLKALREKNIKWWLFYSLTVLAGILTQYYIFFLILSQAIFIVYYLFKESKFNFLNWLKNKNFQLGALSYFLVFLFYLPWLPNFLEQIKRVKESYWIPPINLGTILATFYKLTIGEGIDASKFFLPLVFLIILILLASFYFLKKFKENSKWLIFLSLFLPFLIVILLSLKTSIYLDRCFIFVSAFYLILISGAIFKIKREILKNFLIFFLIFITLISFPLRWLNLEVKKKPGMRGAANYLNQKVKAGDKIYVGSSFVYFTFLYYNKTKVHPLLYAPAPLLHYSGTALLSPKDIIKDFNFKIKKGDTIWLINTTGFGGYQAQVPAHWQKLEEKSFQDVYDYRGWIIVSKYKVG